MTVCRGYHSLPPVWLTEIKVSDSNKHESAKVKAESQGCVKGRDPGRSREWRGWGPGWCMFWAGLILLHVGTHSAGPQQILTLTWRSVFLFILKALNIIIISVFWVSVKSGLFLLNGNNGCLPNSTFWLLVPELQTSLRQFCMSQPAKQWLMVTLHSTCCVLSLLFHCSVRIKWVMCIFPSHSQIPGRHKCVIYHTELRSCWGAAQNSGSSW